MKSKSKKSPDRKISVIEKGLSFSILILLAGIAWGVYEKGKHYDPHLFTLDVTKLTGEVEVLQKNQITPGESIDDDTQGTPAMVTKGGGYDEYSTSSAKPADTAANPGVSENSLFRNVLNSIGGGWKASKPEYYRADTMYEKINGRAEQFLLYDVVGMDCLSVQKQSGGTNRFIDCFVYDMGEPLNAFGIFSSERSPDLEAVSIGREGFADAASLYFWKGKYYCQIIASEEDDDSKQMAYLIATKLSEEITDTGEVIVGTDLLPKENQVTQSLRFIKKNAFGFDFLQKVYQATYQFEGQALKGFLIVCESPEKAKQIQETYITEYLQMFGGIKEDTRNTDGIVVGDAGGVYDAILVSGNRVGGVTEANDPDLAKRFAQWLKSQIDN